MFRYALVVLFLAAPAYAQFFSAGVKAGASLTDALSATEFGNVPYDRHYIIGPTVEMHFPFHLSFEVDALYRRNGFDFSTVTLEGSFFSHTALNDWQFPFLAKYELWSGLIRPFVDAGIAFRHVSQVGTFGQLSNPNGVGFTAGGGLTLKLLLLRISPEIRYTHWAQPPYDSIHSGIRSTANQADFLVGLTF
ncbi:MAG TPA: outer membrane beta-barrel protein [Bryobacteraceae bacterium]|nr:outer membrane beta-barrel protein [Bryobacteraceae bacterium]